MSARAFAMRAFKTGAARLVTCWAGFAGLLAATGGGCPCCGAPACANSLGATGLLGALCAGFMALLRHAPQPLQARDQASNPAAGEAS